jgi:hypothetical protein
MKHILNCERHGLPSDICGPCQAALEERERIIVLIESSEVGGYRDADYIIALIKGEN